MSPHLVSSRGQNILLHFLSIRSSFRPHGSSELRNSSYLEGRSELELCSVVLIDFKKAQNCETDAK